MRITGLKPTVRIYSKTISALVAGHRVDKAHEMFAKMRTVFTDDQIPGALVAYLIHACKFSKDTLRAQGYMKILQQLYENRPCMCNIFHRLTL
jgi:pentatricopeptide repeat protein